VQVVLTLSFDQGAVATEACVAEDAGYDGIATGEHLFFHVPHANSFVALAAAAGATSRIRLLSSLTILPLYPAAMAAKLATTLDQVSGGRFDMGVGIGGEYPAEFVAAGVDTAGWSPVRRTTRTPEPRHSSSPRSVPGSAGARSWTFSPSRSSPGSDRSAEEPR
jgi:alkanesulfonate monooxygenase SsuD/methylene tetrahydromethanopterin reductase-like flavin-dependent oxidoreductase (luciferase family)